MNIAKLTNEPVLTLSQRALAAGPALVYVLGSIGPSDLVSGSIAGSTYGYSLIWLLLLGLTAKFFVADATARYVIASGESLLAGFGRLNRWALLLWFLVAVFQRHASTLAKLLLLGGAAHMACPLPTPHSAAIWGFVSWTAGFFAMYWGRYRLLEKASLYLGAAMGACLLGAAWLSRPDAALMLHQTFYPVLPAENAAYGPAMVVLVLLSATTPTIGGLKYSAYVHEKGWRNVSFLAAQRRELVAGMAGLFVMLAAIQVAAAGALHPRGIQVKKLDDLIPVLADILGPNGAILLGAGLWTILFCSYLGNGTSYGIMFSDLYYRFARKGVDIDSEGRSAGQMPAFRWVVAVLYVSPLYGLFTDWSPIGVLVFKSVANLVVLPVVVVFVFLLTSDRRRMGELVNTPLSKFMLVLTGASALYVTWQGVLEVLAGKFKS